MKITDVKYITPVQDVELGENTIEVKQYLPTREKSNILIAIKELCFQEHLIDQPSIDALFNAFIILNYTNIEFDSRDKDDLLEFYDYLEVQNYIVPIIQAIPEIEYHALVAYYKDTVADFNEYKVTILASVTSMLGMVPELMEEFGKLSEEIDLEAIKTLATISTKIN